MKQIIISICVLIIGGLMPAVTPAHANTSTQTTIHAILFFATDDYSIGSGARASKDYFDQFTKKLDKHTSAAVKTHVNTGSNFTLARLNSVISNLSTSSNDAIFFYYVGHGYNRNQNNYPTLTLGEDGDALSSRQKDLSDIYSALRQKPHRLLIVQAEACNQEFQARNFVPVVRSFDPNCKEDSASSFQRLFVEASGDYLASSSKKGQLSWVTTGTGFYTTAFIEAFSEVASACNKGSITWDAIFESTLTKTANIAAQIDRNKPQNPQWQKGSGSIMTGSTPPPPQKATYLRVDHSSVSFGHSGSTQTISVDTDGKSYSVSLLPSWCSVSRYSKSFELNCQSNSSTSPRNDWFNVESDDRKVRIDVSQDAAPPQNTNVVIDWTQGPVCNGWVNVNICHSNPQMLTGQYTTIYNVPIGEHTFNITGNINCPYLGYCSGAGIGPIMVRPNGRYILRWTNVGYGACSFWLE